MMQQACRMQQVCRDNIVLGVCIFLLTSIGIGFLLSSQAEDSLVLPPSKEERVENKNEQPVSDHIFLLTYRDAKRPSKN